MDDTQKMLKALIKGQTNLSNKIVELSVNIDNVHREVQDLRTETKDGFKKVNDRIDTLGKSLAYLEKEDLQIKNLREPVHAPIQTSYKVLYNSCTILSIVSVIIFLSLNENF